MNHLAKRSLALFLALMTVLLLLPGTNASAAALKQGSRGTEVKYMQQNLIGLGYLEGEADGSYGAKTKAAVMVFQAEFGLAVDGNAGSDTQTAIRNAMVRLQVELKNNGYNPGGADGHFGSKTRNAVKAFQKDQGLSATGVADQATRKALDALTTGLKVTTSLCRGSFGTQVKYLQQALIGLGYLSGSADSSYGNMTTEAVKAYQRAYGLTADGSAGPATLTSIKNAVVALQSDLSRRGYACSALNGVYGSSTTSAVSAYQRACGISATGVAGSATMTKLYGSDHAAVGQEQQEESWKTWIDPLYQTGDLSLVYYRNGTDKTTTVQKSGCAGVALAMALNALLETDEYTGRNVMQWFADNGYYYGNGTYQSGLYKYPRKLGLRTAYCDTASTLISHLKKDRLAIALIRDKTGDEFFTYSSSRGHYILISGYRNKDGVDQVFVNNPLSWKASKWFDVEDLMNNVLNDWNGYENSFVVIYE